MLSRVRFLQPWYLVWGLGNWGKRRRTLIVIDDISEVVTTAVVGFADAHGVMREVDIAVIAWRRSARAWEAVAGIELERSFVAFGNLQKTVLDVSKVNEAGRPE